MNLITAITWLISGIIWTINFATNLDDWWKLLLAILCYAASYWFANMYQKEITK